MLENQLTQRAKLQTEFTSLSLFIEVQLFMSEACTTSFGKQESKKILHEEYFFWVVMACMLEKDLYFRGMCCQFVQGQGVSQAGKQHKREASRALKHWTLSKPHAVITQKTVLYAVCAMGTSNLKQHFHCNTRLALMITWFLEFIHCLVF
jgi:hypothetical protein